VANGPSLLSRVRFGSFFTYSPRGQSAVSKQSRHLRDAIKEDQPRWIERGVTALGSRLPASVLAGWLERDVSLVPVPRHAPLKDKDALWPSRRICEELARQGLAGSFVPCLERVREVPKSAFQARGARPTAQHHLDSMRVVAELPTPARLLVVDDFVTKGATLLAAVSVVRHAFPGADVRGFAFVRTMGLVADVEELIDPCIGTIHLLPGGDVEREP
jgi:hypothetical protein